MVLSEIFIIDAHVHLMTPKRTSSAIRWMYDFYPPSKDYLQEMTVEDMVQELNRAGTKAFFNYFYPLKPGESREINHWQKKMAHKFPNLIPFGSLHPFDKDKAEIVREALDDFQLVGFKFHPYVQDFLIMDPEMLEVYEELDKRKGLVVFHTGFSSWYKKPSLVSELKEFLRAYPGITVLASHMLYLDLPLTSLGEWMEMYSNLYLDVTNVINLCRPEDVQDLKFIIEKNSHRTIMGTDYPMSVARLRDVYVQTQEFCRDEEIISNLFWRTAVHILERFGLQYLKRLSFPGNLLQKSYHL